MRSIADVKNTEVDFGMAHAAFDEHDITEAEVRSVVEAHNDGDRHIYRFKNVAEAVEDAFYIGYYRGYKRGYGIITGQIDILKEAGVKEVVSNA